MKRNSGLIGPKRSPTNVVAVGLFDTFDQYNSRRNSQWPAVPQYISISPSTATSFNEGSSITFTVTTGDVVSGTSLFWTTTTVSGTINTSDFTDFTTSGSFTINNNVGSFSRTLTFDATSEPGDVFRIDIRTGSTSGPIVLSSGNITINNPTFSITPNTTNINEGSSVTFTVSTTNVNNQTMYYSIGTITGSLTGSDFTSGSTTGSFFLSSNAGSFTLTMSNDNTTEGTEQFVVYLRIGSTSGTIAATSSTITVNDTSLSPSATVTPNTTSKNEDGTTVVFSVSTTNFPSGTLYWSINTVAGSITTGDFVEGVTSGSFSVSSSSGSVTLTIRADGITEGTDQFQLQVRLNSTVGTIIGTSSTVTINDTSSGGALNPTRTDFPVQGQAQFVWNRSSSNTTYETPSGWTYTFPSGTPLGHYYIVIWNDYSSPNPSPTASTTYRTRRVFSLHVVSSYNYASRIATATNLPSTTGNGGFERIQGVRITNTTRGQLMTDVIPGSTADVQYNNFTNTIMVVPGDTITISVLLQGPYTEYAYWTHNAY